ncbi:MAG: hypothetical protein KDD62_01380 [Bdellovibrionales bacterium]|nr:hypothetical protein [Bdellovibrionales bacterium]
MQNYYLENHQYLVPFDSEFTLGNCLTQEPSVDKDKAKKNLKKSIERLAELQEILFAHDRFSVLCIFQAMDAAGKDSTIRAVFSGVNPAGFQVFCFKRPSEEVLDHDFLWRSALRLPERGRIGVFNRSYYEEVLVVRVHEEILKNQKLPPSLMDNPWKHRFESIRNFEEHLARNGTVILKFFLNVSKQEQRKRFLDRLEEPEKNWKFEPNDVRERSYWDQYMQAYQEALQETSRPHAPWYAIPADSKPAMRAAVADIIVSTIKKLPIAYPRVPADTLAVFESLKNSLMQEH